MTSLQSPSQPAKSFAFPRLNWRYALGKSLSQVGNAVLASPMMPLTRAIPPGLSYPYDLKRIMQGHDPTTVVSKESMSNPHTLDEFVATIGETNTGSGH